MYNQKCNTYLFILSFRAAMENAKTKKKYNNGYVLQKM